MKLIEIFTRSIGFGYANTVTQLYTYMIVYAIDSIKLRA